MSDRSGLQIRGNLESAYPDVYSPQALATLSLDNQRNLKLAIAKDPLFLEVAEEVAGEMNAWARRFFGREIIAEWRQQLEFTTRIFRARGLHLDDRHIRHADGSGFSASI